MPVIYWIRYPEHKDFLLEGYIGITDNLPYRIKVHKKNAIKNPISPKDRALIGPRSHEIVVDIIFEGTANECADEEMRLRPSKEIGWNLSAGGSYNRRTPEEKLKIQLLRGSISQRQYDLLIKEINNAY